MSDEQRIAEIAPELVRGLLNELSTLRASLEAAERARDEALDNNRKTYDNAVELRKYLESALSENTALRQRLRELIEKWRTQEQQLRRQQLCRQADSGQMHYGARLAARADGFGTCADELAALLAERDTP